MPKWTRERWRRLFGNAHTALITVAGLCAAGALVFLAWMLAFDSTDPVRSQTVVSVEPADRVLDRDRFSTFEVAREICSLRDQQVELVRAWTEHVPDDGPRPTILFTSVFAELKEGCHPYRVRQHIPESLPPGQYVYELHARACNALNRCATHRFDPVPVAVTGGDWTARRAGPIRPPEPSGSVPRQNLPGPSSMTKP